MCRSSKTLRGSDSEPTVVEVRAAALQYVRKVSGYREPSRRNADAFELAVAQVTEATERMLSSLQSRSTAIR